MDRLAEIKKRWTAFDGNLVDSALEFTMEQEVADQIALLCRGPKDVAWLIAMVEELERLGNAMVTAAGGGQGGFVGAAKKWRAAVPAKGGVMFTPKEGSHAYGSRLSECKECSSVAEHELRDAYADIAWLEARVAQMERLGSVMAEKRGGGTGCEDADAWRAAVQKTEEG